MTRRNAPLTPALSPSEVERENRRQAVGETRSIETFVTRALLFPLPLGGGEGQGEGEHDQLRRGN